VLSGERDAGGWWGEGRAADWSDAVDIVRELARELGVDVRVEQAARMPWHPSRCARVFVGEQEFGHAGEIHPRVCQRFGLPRGSAALEIDLDFLMSRAVEVPHAPTFSHQPVAKEDVALVVDDSVSAAEVESALRSGAGELLESIRLFDVYTGPQVGEGKKSLAFALRFRAPDRTLTEAETAAARDTAVTAAAEAVGAVQR
jgi:phenylalanyl-tRNA synthetase beta chain